MSKKNRLRYSHRHHRRPRSRGGDNSEKNISYVDRDQHSAWHLLFKNHEPECIAEIITALWLDPDWEMVARRKS